MQFLLFLILRMANLQVDAGNVRSNSLAILGTLSSLLNALSADFNVNALAVP